MVQNQCSVQFSSAKREKPYELPSFNYTKIFLQRLINFYYQGKMILFFISLILICKYMAMDIDLGNVELPNNILKFGYSIAINM